MKLQGVQTVRASLVAGALAGLVLLAACGKSSGGSPAPAPPPAAAAPAGSAPPPPAAPNAVLPPVSQEVPGVRIGWRVNDVAGALKDAQADHKPVILVFLHLKDINTKGNWFRYYLTNTLRCPTFNSFAGQGHFVLVDLDVAGDGPKLYMGLNVGDLPSMVSLLVDGTNINEQFHADGSGNEAMVMDAPLQAGLKQGTPTAASWLGSAPPMACGVPPGVHAGALPSGLPEVEVELPK